jgi:hypothetical protein
MKKQTNILVKFIKESKPEDIFKTSVLIKWYKALLAQAIFHAKLSILQKPVIYGMDFDLIYAYAFPWSMDAIHAIFVGHVLRTLKTKNFMPFGSVAETFRKTNQLYPRLFDLKYLQELKGYDSTNERKYELFFDLCQQLEMNIDEEKGSIVADSTRIAREIVELVSRAGFALGRLNSFLGDTKRLGLSQVLGEDVNIVYGDPMVRQKLMERFAGMKSRKDYSRNNRADAINLSSIYKYNALDEKQKKNLPEHGKYIIQLFTGTDALTSEMTARMIPEMEILDKKINFFPMYRDSLGHPSMLVTTLELLYFSSIMEYAEQSRPKAMNELSQRFTQCLEAEAFLGEMDMRLPLTREDKFINQFLSDSEQTDRIEQSIEKLGYLLNEPIFKEIFSILTNETNREEVRRYFNLARVKRFKQLDSTYAIELANVNVADNIDVLLDKIPEKFKELATALKSDCIGDDGRGDEHRLFSLHDLEPMEIENLPQSQGKRYRIYSKTIAEETAPYNKEYYDEILIFDYNDSYALHWTTLLPMNAIFALVETIFIKAPYPWFTQNDRAFISLVLFNGDSRTIDCKQIKKLSFDVQKCYEVIDREASSQIPYLPHQIRVHTQKAEYAFELLPEPTKTHRFISIQSETRLLDELKHLFEATSTMPGFWPAFENTLKQNLAVVFADK